MRDATPNDAEKQVGTPDSLPAPDDRPQRSDAIVSRRIGDETILVPVKSTKSALDEIFTLNEVASRTWDLIDGRHTIAEIAAAIASEFEVSPPTALDDTVELIAQFALAEAITLSET
jgi:hypothetical protein